MSPAEDAVHDSQHMDDPVGSTITYEHFVDEAVRDEGARGFMCRSREHEAIVATQLFRMARRKVEIVTRTLDGPLFHDDHVLQAMYDFLVGGRDRHIHVLVEDNLNSYEVSIWRSLRESVSPRQVIIERLDPSHRGMYAGNFILVDDSSYLFRVRREPIASLVGIRDLAGGQRIKSLFARLVVQQEAAA